MKKLICILTTVLAFCCFGCNSGNNSGDSPVVPMPSPPIAESFPIEIDFKGIPDGALIGVLELDGVQVEGVNAVVVGGEILLNAGTLTITSPDNFSEAAVLVFEESGIDDTTIEGLDADDDLITMETTSATGKYYYERLLGDGNVIRKVRVTGLNARVGKMILARPFENVEFNPGAKLPGTWEVSNIVTADFDNDSHPDVALTDAASGQVAVTYADGSGGFVSPSTYLITAPAVDIQVANVNGDDLDDLLILDSEVTVMINNGADFSILATYPVNPALDMATGDFNGDTYPDVVVATSAGLYLLINSADGSGSMGAAQLIPATAAIDCRAVEVEDLDGDGLHDILFGKTSPDEIVMLLGNGDTTFNQAGNSPLLSAPISIVLARLDSDDYFDVGVLMTPGSPNWRTFVNLGDGTLAIHQTFQATSGAAEVVLMPDVNNDGFADMAIIDADSNELVVFASDLVGNLTIERRVDLEGSTGALAAGDMNIDGKTDLLLGISPNEVWVYENKSQ